MTFVHIATYHSHLHAFGRLCTYPNVRGRLDTTTTPDIVHRPPRVRLISIAHVRSISRMSDQYRACPINIAHTRSISRPFDDFALLADIARSSRYSSRRFDPLRATLEHHRDPSILVETPRYSSRPPELRRDHIATPRRSSEHRRDPSRTFGTYIEVPRVVSSISNYFGTVLSPFDTC